MKITISYKHGGKRYHGKRARRQAFYQGEKMARIATRVMRSIWTNEMEAEYEKAVMDCMISGTGYFEYTPDKPGHKFKGLQADAMWMDEAGEAPKQPVAQKRSTA